MCPFFLEEDDSLHCETRFLCSNDLSSAAPPAHTRKLHHAGNGRSGPRCFSHPLPSSSSLCITPSSPLTPDDSPNFALYSHCLPYLLCQRSRFIPLSAPPTSPPLHPPTCPALNLASSPLQTPPAPPPLHPQLCHWAAGLISSVGEML